ncbi:hypothetical protein [Burkholderia glumae]|uniref:hypothetical protein n=1 Tax=Burkholderia glumae TaxID=337 RepID=UPI0006857D9F|nr:hypothetical protein [Burkholderia glumae]
MEFKWTLRYSTIASDSARPAAVRYAAARRCAVIVDWHLAVYRTQQRVLKRSIKELESSPFNRQRIKEMSASLVWLDAAAESLRTYQCSIGRELIDLSNSLEIEIPLDDMLDLMEINAAERNEIERDTELLDEQKYRFMTLAGIYGHDHSASNRGGECKRGAVYWAIQSEIMRVMFDTPEGREASDRLWVEATAPGSLFYGIPTYTMQPDGSMVRNPPTLTVHDADGSHVIESKPRRTLH